MTQLSKIHLNQKVKERVLEIFFQSLADLKTKESVARFLSDFLSPTEKMMLAKRLAIAVMVAKGYDYRTICSVLKVSLGKVTHVALWYKELGTGYKSVVKNILTNEATEKFWYDLNKKFRFLEFRKGQNWSEVRKRHWDEDVKQEITV